MLTGNASIWLLSILGWIRSQLVAILISISMLFRLSIRLQGDLSDSNSEILGKQVPADICLNNVR